MTDWRVPIESLLHQTEANIRTPRLTYQPTSPSYHRYTTSASARRLSRSTEGAAVRSIHSVARQADVQDLRTEVEGMRGEYEKVNLQLRDQEEMSRAQMLWRDEVVARLRESFDHDYSNMMTKVHEKFRADEAAIQQLQKKLEQCSTDDDILRAALDELRRKRSDDAATVDSLRKELRAEVNSWESRRRESDTDLTTFQRRVADLQQENQALVALVQEADKKLTRQRDDFSSEIQSLQKLIRDQADALEQHRRDQAAFQRTLLPRLDEYDSTFGDLRQTTIPQIATIKRDVAAAARHSEKVSARVDELESSVAEQFADCWSKQDLDPVLQQLRRDTEGVKSSLLNEIRRGSERTDAVERTIAAQKAELQTDVAALRTALSSQGAAHQDTDSRLASAITSIEALQASTRTEAHAREALATEVRKVDGAFQNKIDAVLAEVKREQKAREAVHKEVDEVSKQLGARIDEMGTELTNRDSAAKKADRDSQDARRQLEDSIEELRAKTRTLDRNGADVADQLAQQRDRITREYTALIQDRVAAEASERRESQSRLREIINAQVQEEVEARSAVERRDSSAKITSTIEERISQAVASSRKDQQAATAALEEKLAASISERRAAVSSCRQYVDQGLADAAAQRKDLTAKLESLADSHSAQEATRRQSLITRIDTIETGLLPPLQSRLGQAEAQLKALESQVQSHGPAEAKISAIEATLADQIGSVQTRLETKLASTDSALSARIAPLEGIPDRIRQVERSVQETSGVVDHRLNGLPERVREIELAQQESSALFNDKIASVSRSVAEQAKASEATEADDSIQQQALERRVNAEINSLWEFVRTQNAAGPVPPPLSSRRPAGGASPAQGAPRLSASPGVGAASAAADGSDDPSRQLTAARSETSQYADMYADVEVKLDGLLKDMYQVFAKIDTDDASKRHLEVMQALLFTMHTQVKTLHRLHDSQVVELHLLTAGGQGSALPRDPTNALQVLEGSILENKKQTDYAIFSLRSKLNAVLSDTSHLKEQVQRRTAQSPGVANLSTSRALSASPAGQASELSAIRAKLASMEAVVLKAEEATVIYNVLKGDVSKLQSETPLLKSDINTLKKTVAALQVVVTELLGEMEGAAP